MSMDIWFDSHKDNEKKWQSLQRNGTPTTTDNTRGIHFRLVQRASCVYNSSIHLAEISDLLYSTAELLDPVLIPPVYDIHL